MTSQTVPYPVVSLKFDFKTWLSQNYGMKVDELDSEGLRLAEEEYGEEYPPEGESEIKLKTYPFKAYLDSRK